MKNWKYSPAPSLGESPLTRWSEYPSEFDLTREVVGKTLSSIFLTVSRRFFTFKVSGLEHVPAKGPFIIAANHSSHLDTLAILSVLPSEKRSVLHAAAAKDYFFTSTFSGLISTLCFNAIPFDRLHGKRKSIALCQRLLREKRGLLIFPEGSRSTDGELQPFKVGIGILAAGTSVPIIPTRIVGAHSLWPKAQLTPKRGEVSVSFGAPMSFSSTPRAERGFKEVAASVEEHIRKDFVNRKNTHVRR